MISGLSIAATGMQDAMLRMDAAANNIANMNVGPPTTINEVSSETRPKGQGVQTFVQSRESVFGVDLVSEVVNLKMASFSFQASANAAKSADSVMGTLIDMVDSDHDSD